MRDGTIARVRGRQILDSRGFPTVAADVVLASGAAGSASVPAGPGGRSLEAVELRDGNSALYGGRGVLRAVANVDGEIADRLVGSNALDQRTLDEALVELDGTDDCGRLGVNALLAVSLAVARAAAAERAVPLYRHLDGEARALPVPLLNVVVGGVLGRNGIDVQEIMLVPTGAASFAEALRVAAESYHALKLLLEERGQPTGVGDEGAFVAPLGTSAEAIETALEAVARAGHEGRVELALDAAASFLVGDGRYHLAGEGRVLDADGMIDFLEDLVDRYPITMIEDGLAADDWDGWRRLTERLGDRVRLAGDDVFVSRAELLRGGAEAGVANAIVLKPNQLGTVTATLDAVAAARDVGYAPFLSHRLAETEDAALADLAVAAGVAGLKAGPPARSERVAKYNRLLLIEEQLGPRAAYSGRGTASADGSRRAGC